MADIFNKEKRSAVMAKITGKDTNIIRDRRHTKKLLAMGWNVIVVWECEIKTKKNALTRLEEIYGQLIANTLQPVPAKKFK